MGQCCDQAATRASTLYLMLHAVHGRLWKRGHPKELEMDLLWWCCHIIPTLRGTVATRGGCGVGVVGAH